MKEGMRSIDKKLIQKALDESCAYNEAIRKLGLNYRSAGNFQSLKMRIENDGLSIDKLEENRKKSTKKYISKPTDELLVANSTASRSAVKRRILKENLLKYECNVCKFSGEWNNKPISLILDHINGMNNDHRLENLQFVCPMCNSQLDTFGSRNPNAKRNINNVKKYCDCGKEIDKTSTTCIECHGRRKRKFEISKKELASLIANYSMVEVGKKLGVSDNAVRKRAKKLGII